MGLKVCESWGSDDSGAGVLPFLELKNGVQAARQTAVCSEHWISSQTDSLLTHVLPLPCSVALDKLLCFSEPGGFVASGRESQELSAGAGPVW